MEAYTIFGFVFYLERENGKVFRGTSIFVKKVAHLVMLSSFRQGVILAP